MNTAFVPTKITIPRRRFGGLLIAVAAGSAAVGGALAATAFDDATDRGSDPAIESPAAGLSSQWSARQHIAGVLAATPEELAATYGNIGLQHSATGADLAGASAATPEELAATYGNVRFGENLEPTPYLSQEYLEGISTASPEELAATYGNLPVEP